MVSRGLAGGRKVDLVIRGCAAITMDRERPFLAEAEIGVADRSILYVRPAGGAGSSYAETGRGTSGFAQKPGQEGARVLDGRGKLCLPGLVNAHCHAAMTLLRGYADDMRLMPWLTEKIWPLEARLTGEDVYWGTLLACAEMLRAGITAFADMYFFMDEAARACADAGIRASLSVGMIAAGEGGGVAPDAWDKLERAAEFCRRWEGAAGGRITTMLGPHAPYTCPPDFLRRVVEMAGELDVAIHIHLSETEGEVRRCRQEHGCSPVQLMEAVGLFSRPVLAAHCVHVDEADLSVLARMRGGVAHNPLSNMKLASGVAPVAAMLAAGVPVALGTDGAASTNALGLFEEMRACSLLQKVTTGDPTAMPAREVLELATVGGARALGLEGRVGLLAPGYAADLVLLRLDEPRLTPLHDPWSLAVYSAQDGDVDTVLVDGRVVVEGGRLLTVDEEEVRREAARRAAALVAGA